MEKIIFLKGKNISIKFTTMVRSRDILSREYKMFGIPKT